MTKKLNADEIESAIQSVQKTMDLLSANGFYTSAVIAAAEEGIFRVFKGAANRAHQQGGPLAGQDH